MNIIRDKTNGIDTQTSYVPSGLNRNEVSNCVMEEELISIRLADVDLGTGKRYVFGLNILHDLFIISVDFNILKTILFSYRNMVRGRVTSKSTVRTYGLDQHKLFYS